MFKNNRSHSVAVITAGSRLADEGSTPSGSIRSPGVAASIAGLRPVRRGFESLGEHEHMSTLVYRQHGRLWSFRSGFDPRTWPRPCSSMDRAAAFEAVGCGFNSFQGHLHPPLWLNGQSSRFLSGRMGVQISPGASTSTIYAGPWRNGSVVGCRPSGAGPTPAGPMGAVV